jgi:AraC family transcriptional regulator
MAALRYCRSGFRDYHVNAVPIYPRSYWEFQSFTDGTAIMEITGGTQVEVRAPSLWVLPPWFAHGWNARPGQTCEVAVFHFDGVDPVVERAVERQARLGPQHGYLRSDLAVDDCGRLRELARLGREDVMNPGLLSNLLGSLILAEISLMALRAPAQTREPFARELNQRKVRAALAWYESHLHEAPGFEQVARAAHISVPHLRRLFHQTLGSSPSEALDRIRFERVNLLLADHANTLQSIAERCGFGSASTLSRAYRRRYGKNPRR